MKISFGDAALRWHDVAKRERDTVTAKAQSDPHVSWEAADHAGGLAVESGMKALMLHHKWITPDAGGDYPKNSEGRRPHVDELWGIFFAKAKGRNDSGLLKALTPKGKSDPVAVFADWKPEHRYAPDGTVTEAKVTVRFDFLGRLRRVLQEEGF